MKKRSSSLDDNVDTTLNSNHKNSNSKPEKDSFIKTFGQNLISSFKTTMELYSYHYNNNDTTINTNNNYNNKYQQQP